ncbi:MAG TPA: hypothetical protein VE890_00945, partial [Thermoguttaceae bacterium]|nr:hypothetical protein [Thermoguttaceae bacterium]
MGKSAKTAANKLRGLRLLRRCGSPSLIFFLLMVAGGLYAGIYVSPTWLVERISLDVSKDDQGRLSYVFEDKHKSIDVCVPMADAQLNTERIEQLNAKGQSPEVKREYVFETAAVDGKPVTLYYELKATQHWRLWSLLPALAAVGLCWLTREPLLSLFGGIVVGALL